MPDYYEVLQVSPRAEPEVVRAAYRSLARKYHPDHGGGGERMIALNDAWDVLGDPIRRAAYDATRADLGPRTAASAQAAAGAPAAAASPSRNAGAASSAATSEAPHAGPPPGRPSGTVLDFGRYAGWSLGEIARYDIDYLEWLQRATFGRRLRTEIDALLRARRGASGGTGGAPAAAPADGLWPRRR